MLREMGAGYNDDKVLVVLDNPPPFPVREDRKIRVTGEVRRFVAKEFETDYNLTWDLDIQRQLEAEYERFPAVVAKVTKKYQPQQQNRARQNQQQGAKATSISLEQVAEETDKLRGNTVAISGKVDKIIGPNAFIMQEMGAFYNDDKVLVVLRNPPQVPIIEDRQIRVTGEVRRFVAVEFEKDFDLTWDLELKRKLEAEYEKFPAVVARVTR